MDDANAVPEFTISQPRVSTMACFRHFSVHGRASTQTIAQMAMTLIDQVCAEYRGAHAVTVDQPSVILSYGMPEATGEFDMWAGLKVRPDMPAAGKAAIEDVPSQRCASVVLCGSLKHLGEAHQQLMQYVEAQGLRYGLTFREWYLYWEGEDTPNNVTMVTYDII